MRRESAKTGTSQAFADNSHVGSINEPQKPQDKQPTTQEMKSYLSSYLRKTIAVFTLKKLRFQNYAFFIFSFLGRRP